MLRTKVSFVAEATKRGMGAVLMRKPDKLARLVAGIAAESALPLTVKLRTGAKGVTESNLAEVKSPYCREPYKCLVMRVS